MSIKRYPFFVPPNWRKRGMAVFPHIFMPDSYWSDPVRHTGNWMAYIAHEQKHLDQQSGAPSKVPVFFRLVAWCARYLTDKKFRLQMEAEAIAVEVLYSPTPNWSGIAQAARALSGKDYGFCCTYDEALSAIAAELEKLRR